MGAIRQYIGARYVPKFFDNGTGSAAWISGVEYEPLTIVTYLGNSYTSKKPVPANIGNPASNGEYWVATGNYNAQVEIYRQEVQDAIEGIDADIQEAVSGVEAELNETKTELETEMTNTVNQVQEMTDELNDKVDEAVAGLDGAVDSAVTTSYKNAFGPIVIAHRGFLGEAPENTLAAFDLCGSLNVDAVETDLQFTSDGVPVCCHNADISAYTASSGNISNYTYAQLSEIPVTKGNNITVFGNQRIPSFEEYVLHAYVNRFIPFIEIKSDYTFDATMATTVLNILKKYQMNQKAVFISNNLSALDVMLGVDPSANVCPVLYVEPTAENLALWAGKGYFGVSAALEATSANAVATAHSLGMRFYTWTVSTYAQWWGLQTYMSYGVDGFTCDLATLAVLPNWEHGVRVMGSPNYDGFVSSSKVDTAFLGLRCYVRGWLGGYDVRDPYAFGAARFFFNNTNRLCFRLPEYTKTVTFHANGNANKFRYSVFSIDDNGQVTDSGWITVTNNMVYTIPTTRKNVFMTIGALDNNTAMGYIDGKNEFERLNVTSTLS